VRACDCFCLGTAIGAGGYQEHRRGSERRKADGASLA
jgi:hypothetical protein